MTFFHSMVEQPPHPSQPDLYCSETRNYSCFKTFCIIEKLFGSRSSIDGSDAARLIPGTILLLVSQPSLHSARTVRRGHFSYRTLSFSKLSRQEVYWRSGIYLGSLAAPDILETMEVDFNALSRKKFFVQTRMRGLECYKYSSDFS